MRRIAEEDNDKLYLRYKFVHIKVMIDALCQDKPSCSPRLSFWPPNSSDLNPLNYYVWSIIDHEQVSASQYDVIKDFIKDY